MRVYCGLLWTIVAVDYCSEWIIVNSTELGVTFFTTFIRKFIVTKFIFKFVVKFDIPGYNWLFLTISDLAIIFHL